MIRKYLNDELINIIEKQFNFKMICEIRLRKNSNVQINYSGKKYMINYKFSEYDMQEFILKITENSLYRLNEQIKYGFLCVKGGIRIGLAGDVVYDKENLITMKNIQSANIRLPHNIDNCSMSALPYILGNDIKNTLIISKPGAGKTTYLRDIVRQIDKRYIMNILVADERNELANVDGMGLGENVDIYTNCSKDYAFRYGIRSMNPNIFITDELNLEADIETLISCTNSGIKLISTLHCDNIENLKKKPQFDKLAKNKIFDRILVLDNKEKIGELSYVFDSELHMIYCK